jgi:hypothetical protein
MLCNRQYQSNGAMKTSMGIIRGLLFSAAVGTFAFAATPAHAKCDPATDPDCKAVTAKKDTKKSTSDTPKVKKTKSAEAPAESSGEPKKRSGSASKTKKSAGGEEQITEENREPGPAQEKRTGGGQPHVNPVEVDKATGQHCSGKDEYRVCW